MAPEVPLGTYPRTVGHCYSPVGTPSDPHSPLRSSPQTYSGHIGRFPGRLRQFGGDRRPQPSTQFSSNLAILPQYGPRNCCRIRQVVSDSTNLVSSLQCPGTVERTRQVVSGSSNTSPDLQCGVLSHSACAVLTPLSRTYSDTLTRISVDVTGLPGIT